jgi:hypothetical protein
VGWQAVPGAASYDVIRNSVPSGSAQSTGLIGNVGVGANLSGTTYSFVDNGQVGQPCNPVAVSTTAALSVDQRIGVNTTSPDSGLQILGGGAHVSQVAAVAAAPSVGTNNPVTGQSYSYYVVAKDAVGNKALASPTGSIANGASPLAIGNYNSVTWSPAAGAASYDVFRSAVPAGSGLGTGLIGAMAAAQTFYDGGQAVSSGTYPSPGRNGTGDLTVDGNVVVGGAAAATAGAVGYSPNAAGTGVGALQYGDGTAVQAVASLDQAETLTNKTLANPILAGAPAAGAGALGWDATNQVPTSGDGSASHDLVTVDQTQTLNGKTLSNPIVSGAAQTGAGALGFASSKLSVGDGSASHNLVSEDQTQTLTNKTLSAPVLAGTPGTAAGQLGWDTADAVPTSGDGSASHDLVPVDQAQTLSNKTLTAPVVSGHLVGGSGTAPTATPLSALGSGGTAALASGSTDLRGQISLTSGSSPSAGSVVTVSFAGGAFATSPIVMICYAGLHVANQITVYRTSTTAFTINMVNAPAPSTNYLINYIVVG